MRRLDLGQLFDRRYRILDAVGSGPLSVLYRARDEARGSLVALKIPSAWVSAEVGADSRFDLSRGSAPGLARGELCHASRLIDEGMLGLRLCHENIARTVACEIAECSTPYVAVEWLDGEPLVELVDREGPLPLLRALEFVRGAAAGLSALHQCGYVHCDVKPENLFVSTVGGGLHTVKVLDLGLARPVGQRPGGDAHVVAGTLKYIAPEQVANEALDARTDVYALGVVLFRLLTGVLPFDTGSPTALLGHQLFSPPPPPSWFLDHAEAAEADKIVLTALRKSPTNRYASMRELIADIDRVGRGEPALGRGVRGTDRFEPETEHGRQAVAIVARTARIIEASATESTVTSGIHGPPSAKTSAA